MEHAVRPHAAIKANVSPVLELEFRNVFTPDSSALLTICWALRKGAKQAVAATSDSFVWVAVQWLVETAPDSHVIVCVDLRRLTLGER